MYCILEVSPQLYVASTTSDMFIYTTVSDSL